MAYSAVLMPSSGAVRSQRESPWLKPTGEEVPCPGAGPAVAPNRVVSLPNRGRDPGWREAECRPEVLVRQNIIEFLSLVHFVCPLWIFREWSAWPRARARRALRPGTGTR